MGKLFEFFRKPRSDDDTLKKRLGEVAISDLPTDAIKPEMAAETGKKAEPSEITYKDLGETQFLGEYKLATECRPIILKSEQLKDSERNKLLEFKEALFERITEMSQYRESVADKPLKTNLEKTIALIEKRLSI